MVFNFKTFFKRVNILILNQKFIFIFYCLVTVIASIQKYLTNGFSVYFIYKYASAQLLSLLNIYQPFPGQDIFLYSPTFAFFFIPFTFCPDIIGGILWNLLSISALFVSIQLLNIKSWQKSTIFGIIFFEALLSLQNLQANVLLTATCLFIFVFFEKNKYLYAAFFAALGFFIKIFGIGFAILFLFYRKKLKFILYLAACCIVLLLIPLVTSNFDINYLIYLYREWGHNLIVHQDKILPINIYGVISDIFPLQTQAEFYYAIVLLFSILILALPLLRFSLYKTPIFKQYFLSSLLIWVVIFSKNAESPTYIIAMTGVAIWFISDKPTPIRVFLVTLAIVFTSLSATDLFPPSVRASFCYKYRVKFYPCFIIWLYIQAKLLFKSFKY